ncbi:MAG: hypothetical protein K6D95_04625 [Treponema sp.]|nr:hypothetical protein [Treponema sp.]
MAKPELLNPCTTVLDDDIVIITHAGGLTERISGSDLKSVMRSGNAASATKWANARNINGLSIDGQANRVNYAVCSTAAATVAKVCACAGFALITGSEITVKFSVTNTASNPTLNVNATGAKAIYYRGSAITPGLLAQNRSYTFRYNGTQYELIGEALLNASGSAAGLMSAADKTKLDGIASDINTQVAAKVASSAIGAANGVASLDSAGKVPSNQLPSYVDDVLEYAALSSFPATGETGKIYVAKDTNKSYRWSGSTYVELSSYAEASTSASGLMSAADKTKLDGITKGSAAGNVPVVGTALGTTNNNIVVTDSNGKLKPSGTTIGSAAGKTAGSAAGNVPLVGTALGTTDYNVAVTNTSGALKPYGVTAPNLATYGLYVTGSASISSNIATFTVTNLTGLTASAGTVVKVCFKAALQSASAINQVKLTFAGKTGIIKAVRSGSLINVASHLFSGGNYSSSAPYKVWDAYTTLELMWTGSEWLIMGDPVLCSYVSETLNYTIKGNGFIDISGIDEGPSGGTGALNTITFPIKFNSTIPFCTTGVLRPQNDGLPEGTFNVRLINTTQLTYGYVVSGRYTAGAQFAYHVTGY